MDPRVFGVAFGQGPSSVPSKPARGPLHHLKIAGAVGRLGEAFVNAALARADVGQVDVLVSQPFSQSPPKLRGLDEGLWLSEPGCDALILLPLLDHDGLTRLGNARDAVYSSLEPAVMRRLLGANAQGLSRVLLIHPLAAWQQIGAFQQGLAGPIEEQVAGSGADSVTIVRPVLSANTPGGSWLQRIVNGYLSLQLLMMPRSLPSLTSAQIASLALNHLAQAGPGVQVIGAADLASQVPEPNQLK
jgi:hypothetical protein